MEASTQILKPKILRRDRTSQTMKDTGKQDQTGQMKRSNSKKELKTWIIFMWDKGLETMLTSSMRTNTWKSPQVESGQIRLTLRWTKRSMSPWFKQTVGKPCTLPIRWVRALKPSNVKVMQQDKSHAIRIPCYQVEKLTLPTTQWLLNPIRVAQATKSETRNLSLKDVFW